ncbi:two-component regulator propeller domain-containing protein [bacterium]
MWLGTVGGGVNLYHPETKTFTHFKHDETNRQSIVGNDIYSIAEDIEGNLWFGCSMKGISVMRVNQNSPSFYTYRQNIKNEEGLIHNSVRVLCPDENGMWIGTQNWGLEYFDFETKTFHHHLKKKYDPASINDNSIYSIFIDHVGDLWIGTYVGGVSVAHGTNQGFKTYQHVQDEQNCLSDNDVWEFDEDEAGIIWIATDGGGLNRFDPKNEAFRNYNSQNSNLNQDAVLTVYVDSMNDVWIGTWDGGFSRFDRSSHSFETYTTLNSGLLNNNVMDIAGDQQGNLWLATQYGLHKFNIQNQSFRVYTPENSDLIFYQMEVVKVDCRGHILLGNVSGFIIFDPENETFSNYIHDPKDLNSLSNNFITSIFEEDSTTLWIATTNGLNKLNRDTQEIIRFSQNDGLPNNLIAGVELDRFGYLWVSTNGGLSRFDPKNHMFQNYTKEDGLQGNVFIKKSHLRSQSGLLYYGGTNGFNVFESGKIDYNEQIPAIAFTDFKILNFPDNEKDNHTIIEKQIYGTDSIILSHKHNAFYFEFAALNYVFSAKNQYMHRLNGFDRDWHVASTQRRATYTNIPPGQYTFQVKASNNDGIWNEDGVAAHLIIRPPFWQKSWFRILIVIMIGGLLFSGYKLRTHRMRTYNRELEMRVKERTNQLEEANKELEAFSYSVSHDLRAPLRAMNGFSKALEEDYCEHLDTKAKDYLHRIRLASQRMGRLIDGLLKLSRLSRSEMHLHQVNLSNLVQSIVNEYQKSDSSRVVEFIIKENIYVKGDVSLLRVMIRNLIDNAWKFTCKTSNARIQFDSIELDGKIVYVIKDNGIGFDMRYSNQLFEVFQRQNIDYEGTGIGLATVKRIVNRHGGQIWAEGKMNGGAVFYFTFN